ncbi:MAG: DegT/DnrJ/EryC1/StrS family aminotransferase [Candidatus Accumulibacter sp.]|uniref:DegT/DnrJ/EryC1/StrS family aminotransferase n=1 Tax=Candidatus Accumulibacter proximus TaxID=2954385 RepID=A0A935UGZ7_9PROT|nr:DegT/DnrJ/EryC1/StrS family aminotransferase [Candidatus Accumulibacter proximus]
MNITEPKFGVEELELVKRCLDSKWVTQGPLTSEFERLFAMRHAVEHAMATTSCTAALHLAALALQLQCGDEVVVPAFTWVTSAHAAEYVGAKAVFSDVNLSTFNIDPVALEAAITPRTRAVVVVHLFGKAAPMDEIMAIAKRHGIAVIEDAACAVGTTYNDRPIGAIGDLGCFSFHPRKVITTGEGGMVTTNRDDLANRVKCLRNHGATGPAFGADPSKPYTMSTFDMLGFNLRLSDIQAAVGVAQMARLDSILAERRRLALRYSEMLAGLDEITVPVDDAGHTYQSYVTRLSRDDRAKRNEIMEHLADRGIQTRPGTHAVHRLGYYAKKYGLQPEQFPNACRAEDTTITLPIFPGMTDQQQTEVVKAIRSKLG